MREILFLMFVFSTFFIHGDDIVEGKFIRNVVAPYPTKPPYMALRWYDGRGIIFDEVVPGGFLARANTYEISRGMNVLEIRYRIVLPYPTLNIDNLRRTPSSELLQKYTSTVIMIYIERLPD